MKTALVFALIFVGSVSQAMTSGRFLGQQFMINIAAQNPDGSVDSSPQKLFDAMNVPVQDSMLGPGKALKAEQKVLNFICANRGSGGGYTCMILIHQSAAAQIGLHKASFHLQGETARNLSAQFFLNDQNHFNFEDDSGLLSIKVSPDTIDIIFQE